MKVALEEITVKKAQEWLKHNPNNRPIRQSVVAHYADAIRRGEWVVNGETIKFNCDGRLADGQHRLYAVVASGKSIKSYVVREVPENAFDSIDQGAPRTLGDVFARHGEQNCKALGAATRSLSWLFAGSPGTAGWVRLTGKQALEVLKEHPGLRNSVEHARKAMKIIPMSCGITLHYQFRQKDPALADIFFDAMATGESLKKSDPVYRLREQMLGRGRGRAKRLAPGVVMALTIKAWNATRKGRPLQALQWRVDESFPEIE
jgi:hypothetical protein